MGHPRKSQNEPCCYHVTHRCHERRFLLRFRKDRRRYLRRLWEASRKYDVSVLDYIVTSNHVHILFHSRSATDVSEAMRYVQGNSARDYNLRKGREGAFWKGRYRPTMIQDGAHLARCIFYIDMNMVRAGECSHPSEWMESGYHELSGRKLRYRIVDMGRLLKCLGHKGDRDGFARWYERSLGDCAERESRARYPIWTESLAIGEKKWLLTMRKGIHGIEMEPLGKAYPGVRESVSLYRLSGSSRAKEAFWKKRQNQLKTRKQA